MTDVTIGIDISKDHLDAHRLPDATGRRFANDHTGLRALIGWIGSACVVRVVYEATGAYHRLLETSLARAGWPLAKVNPRQARRFAEAAGVLAKTDRVDAAMLARFGVALAPAPTRPLDPALDDLRDLHLARRSLVKDRTAAKNRQAVARLPLIKRQLALRLAHIDRQLKAIDAEINTRLQAEADFRRRMDILTSMPGISTITALAILVEMPEIGQLGSKQAASLAGLAPMNQQSGAKRRKASIRGGRAILRQALYMPALVAMRFHPDLEAKYQSLIAAGKPAKVAITTLMRKLIIIANALIRDDRRWAPIKA